MPKHKKKVKKNITTIREFLDEDKKAKSITKEDIQIMSDVLKIIGKVFLFTAKTIDEYLKN